MLTSRHPAFKFHIPNKQHHRNNAPNRNSQDLDQYSDYLEVHRRNIILDFKKKVQEIKTMREKLSKSVPQRKTAYIKYKTQRSQVKKRMISQRLMEASGQSRDDKKVSVNTLHFNGISLRESEILKMEETVLTPFQKYLQHRMRVKKELIQKKKSIKYVLQEKTPEKSSRFRESFVHNFRIFTE